MTEEKISLSEQVNMGFVVFTPLVALIVGMMPFWPFSPDGVAIAIFINFYYLATLGVTVGYHRYLTHSSFKEKYRSVKNALTVAGIFSGQGGPIMWVSWHRTHHKRSDKPGDPHSPHLHGSGLWAAINGAIHAHVWWLFVTPRSDDHTKALQSDSDIVRLDRWAVRIFLFGLFVAPPLLGALARWSLDSVHIDILWGGFIRLFCTNHATWSVNSVCHLWGRRPFDTDDKSRNNWLVVLLASGEGWHNNHHAFQWSAKQGLLPGQFDLSWLVIQGMWKLGLIEEPLVPDEDQISQKLAAA